MIQTKKKNSCMLQSSCPTEILWLNNAETSHISIKTEIENKFVIFAIYIDNEDLHCTKKSWKILKMKRL